MLQKSISEILVPNTISVSPETLTSEAVSIMKTNKISCLLVIQNKKPVGIFTERDIVRLLYYGVHAEKRKIAELMTKPVFTVDGHINIYQAHDLMEKNRLRHLVAVEPDGQIIGVVTQTNIIENLETEYFFQTKDVSKIMTKDIVTIDKEHLVQEAINKMAKLSLSCIVVQENKAPVGILTERDVTRLFHEKAKIIDLKIKNVMSHPVQTIPVGTSLYKAISIMAQNRIRRLVVVDKNGKIKGLITQYDTLKELEWRYIEFLNNILRQKDKQLLEAKKDAEAKLIQSEKLAAAAQIASEVAHEIRNPLCVIKAGLYYLKQILPKDQEAARKSILQMNAATDKATSYINNLLSFSRPPMLQLKLVEINEVLEESLKELPAQILSCIEVTKDFEPALPQIKADPQLLKQVFVNLIKNACEAMEEELRVKELRIKSEEIDKRVVQIAISDTGCGIKEENLTHIFNLFFATKSKGIGLGLAICQRIVEAHKGEIEVKSKVGQGTTFIIRIRA
ncbi:MAG: CBS domain-containing protein [bacterium]|nr:CBS domain-containing protein [bacterium]